MAEKKSVRCVIISGGTSADLSFIKNFIMPEDYVICADRGYAYAKQINIIPDLIVGDFDSYSGSLPDTEIITLNTHKDDTDTAHCAKVAVERGFKEICILCALGGRNDHSFANLCLLQYLDENSVNCKLIDKSETVEFKTKGVYEYNNLKDKTFSIFPFSCNEAVVTFQGNCEYPAEKLTLSSSLAMGISNIFRSDKVNIEIIQGKVLIFIENI